jgi:uncharacterized protein (TIGR02246 family)
MSMTTDESAIRALVEQWAQAVRARDIDGILAHHSPDMLMFDVPPPFVSKGLAAYRQTWDVFYASSEEPAVFAFDSLDITAGEEVAFVTAEMHCTVKEESGDFSPLEFRLTMGLRKIDGVWTIVHEHHSIPAV